MSRFLKEDILADRRSNILRLRCYYRMWAYSRVTTSMFFLNRESLRVTNFNGRRFRRGYRIKQSRFHSTKSEI